jgi:hypothetical protein
MTPTHDPRSPHDHRGHAVGPAPRAQWLGLLLAPAVFFAHLQTGYLLVQFACRNPGGMVWVHVAHAISVALGALGIWMAWTTWQRAGGDEPGDDGTVAARTRMMGVSGLGLSAVVTLILAAQWVPAFVLSPCQ